MKSRDEIRAFLQPDINKAMRCPLCTWTTGALQDCEFCKGNEDIIVDGLMAFFYPPIEKPKVKKAPKPRPKKIVKKRLFKRKKK